MHIKCLVKTERNWCCSWNRYFGRIRRRCEPVVKDFMREETEGKRTRETEAEMIRQQYWSDEHESEGVHRGSAQ